MKITRLKAEGFRSLRSPQTIELKNGRSMCLLADNGRGKSSVADALEFWSTGDVRWVRRDGVGLGALVHLSAEGAVVEVATDSVVAKRRLTGAKASDLDVTQGVMLAGSALDPIPILRRRTMSSFVDKSANDKRGELLTMLGLTELVPFRLGVRSAAKRARDGARSAEETAQMARSALEETLGGVVLEDKIAELASRAGLTMASEQDLLDFSGTPGAGIAPAATRLAEIEELEAANAAVRASSVAGWNAALADQKVAGEQGLSALLAAGRQLLTTWEQDRCPLCLVEQPRDELVEQVQMRALELAEADRRFSAVAAEAEEREQVILRLGRALRAVVDDHRNRDWPGLDTGRSVLGELRSDLQAVKEARASRAVIGSASPSLPDAALASLRADVARAPVDAGTALLDLARLRAQVIAERTASRQYEGAQRLAVAAERAAEIAEEKVERAIDTALNGLNSTIGSFYSKLIGSSPYGDVKLNYQYARAGGVEFSFVWDGSETVSPPQRVMSESQLGALGLALFLARLKVRPPQWRAMVLDDVVTSFDIVHRTRLVRLLSTEFGEWQIILCTHDQQLSRVIHDETTGWHQVKIVSWTPSGGTVFGEANPRKRLRELLQKGHAADELGGLARGAMEQALERPVRKMGLRIRHDPHNLYSADEYRRALLDGLREGGYLHAQHPVLQRLATGGSVTNRACHFKDHEPGVTAADLELLLDDLDAFDALFRCDSCDKPPWEVRDIRSAHCQCPCGRLSCA